MHCTHHNHTSIPEHCRHPRTLTLSQHTHMQHKQQYTHNSHRKHPIYIGYQDNLTQTMDYRVQTPHKHTGPAVKITLHHAWQRHPKRFGPYLRPNTHIQHTHSLLSISHHNILATQTTVHASQSPHSQRPHRQTRTTTNTTQTDQELLQTQHKHTDQAVKVRANSSYCRSTLTESQTSSRNSKMIIHDTHAVNQDHP